MTPTPPPGPELPSTLGGKGWQARLLSHAEDAHALWGRFGVSSHFSTLREVMLAVAGDELRYPEDPSEWLMSERPDLARLQAETLALAAAYEAEGVTVRLHRPSGKVPPNHLFLCDLFFVTPEGAIVARMAARQRAGEERYAAEGLARLGIPILHTVRGKGTFEGADAMWLSPREMLVGVGRRTNAEGYEQVSRVFAEQGVVTHAVEIGVGVQHLLGAVVVLDGDLACVLSREVPDSLRLALSRYRLIELPSDEETVDRRGMNLVPLGPRRVIMPAHCPRTRERLEAHGVSCVEAEVSQYICAAGAIGCLTGILRRD